MYPSYNSANTRGETLQIGLQVFKGSEMKVILIHFLLTSL